ncbi:MAG TPA: HD domain-containing phosphohydrolase [Casimicrobiaceae bacterium]
MPTGSDFGSTRAVAAWPLRDRGRRRLPFHVHIATLLSLFVIAAGGVIAWHNQSQNRELIISGSQELVQAIGGKTVAGFQAIYQPVELMIDVLAHQRLRQARNLAERMESVGYMAAALEHVPALSALYIGYSGGDFFLVRPLRNNAAVRAQFRAPAGAAYLVQSIERGAGGSLRGTYVFLDSALATVERREVPDYVYDPRTRDWYQQAQATSQQVKTAPYVFFSTGEVGVTFARRADGDDAVVGADLTLVDLSRALQEEKLTPSSELVLFNADGVVLAYDKPERMALDSGTRSTPRLAKVSELGSPVLTRLMQSLPVGDAPAKVALDVAGRQWAGTVSRLHVEGEPEGVYLAVLSPEDELLSEAGRISRETLLITLLIVLLCIPVAWLLSRLVANPLRSLVREARAVRDFDFAAPIATRSIVAEVDELATTMGAMKVTIREFLNIAATISAEHDFGRLLDRVLTEMISAADSSAGAIYLFDADTRALRSAATRTRPGVAASPSLAEIGNARDVHPAWRVIAEGKTVVAPLEPACDDLARLVARPEGAPGAGAFIAIAVPLRNRDNGIIGVVCLLNDAHSGALPRELVSFIEALSGTAAIAIENQDLLRAQKALLDSFIRLVAGAIDAKSPYTGGHCQRVPELATMLARAACDAKEGPFRDFDMNDDEWEALRIAAWLHDCGKVTTPEYVVDKATKLQTIYDRLHEVRMRFEVLKRDAEIEYWQQVAGGGDAGSLRAKLQATCDELDAEFAFVATCNQGGEFMEPGKVARIEQIARRTWRRTLDDRIGLSAEERDRTARTSAPLLPVVEQLLADKPEHLTEWSAAERAPEEDRLGLRIEVPRHKRNNGEIYNLCIGRGTLNGEERHQINDHVVQTIRMLSQLPFPRHLKAVPEIAGGHHERLDGTGYPKRLRAEELSLQARMMAIADIFEALTARDRPYKKGKTLSEAIRIMAQMRRERHIDGELFELFLSSGIYRRYAERFLHPSQIDDVDLEGLRSGAQG